MKQYLDLLQHVLDHGVHKADRLGAETLSVFGAQLRLDLTAGFPLLTTKRLRFEAVAGELLWFLSGSTAVADLHAYGVHRWDSWAEEDGTLGPIYGAQWRHWPDNSAGVIDQIEQVVQEIRRHPESRRLVVSAWNVADLPAMALPPCHFAFQFYVHAGRLSC